MTPQLAREAETGKTGRCRTAGRLVGVLRRSPGQARQTEDAAVLSEASLQTSAEKYAFGAAGRVFPSLLEKTVRRFFFTVISMC